MSRNIHLQMVRDFHTAFKYEQDLGTLTPKMFYARPSYISEEMAELLRDKAGENRVGQLDALCDMAYFSLGTLAILGREVTSSVLCIEADLSTAFCRLMEAHFGPGTPPDRSDMDELFMQKMKHSTEVLAQFCSAVYWNCRQEAEQLLGADFDGAFAEVQRSNMSKLGEDGEPIYSESGKILKGPNFSEPELEQFLGD